ncbi:protein TASOR isoform 2-T2 [Rhinophrynus dorsalis]
MEDSKDFAPMESRVGGRSMSVTEDVRCRTAQNGEFPEDESREFRRSEASSVGVKLPDETPMRRFQIPRKSREKKALQLINSGTREFEEIMRILHSSYLDANSKANFSYKCARLVHNEFLEKEFTEKRRQLKCEGRLDKELAESYAFLLVDQEQINNISEKGLHVGHSRITTLGKSAMGVYLSRYADLLQANPLEAGATGNIFIFKVIKGKMKCVFDNIRHNQMDQFAGNGGLDPAPKHECHILKNMNTVTSLLSYRAFERTQYYFYEYGFDEILKRPRHVCPYAVVSFGYKDEMASRQQSLSIPGPVGFSSERNDRSCFTVWRGQLLNQGKLLCYASLKSTTGPFVPYRLPEKLDLDVVMHIDQIKKKIPTALFYKETHSKEREAMHGGVYGRLYEVVEKTRTGSHLQTLLQKIDTERLALVKPLEDQGFLFLFFPSPMTSSYGAFSGKSRLLHALFIYQESRVMQQPASSVSTTSAFKPDNHEIMPDLMTFISSLHVGLLKSQKDNSGDINTVVEKHARTYLKRRAERAYEFQEYIPKAYESRLDYKKSLYPAPKNKSHVDRALRSYIFGAEAYILPVETAKELIRENPRLQQFSPVSDYEPIEDDQEVSQPYNKKGSVHDSYSEAIQETLSDSVEYDPDKINGLINLIQKAKQNSSSRQESDDESNGRFKRKHEDEPESPWKSRKGDDSFHGNSGEEPADTPHSMSTFISELGGQDTDLRQESPELPVADTSDCIKLILATLADTGYLNPSVLEKLKVLAAQNETTENSIQHFENISPVQDTIMADLKQHEQTYYGDQQSIGYQEDTKPVLSQATDDVLLKERVGDYHPVIKEESVLDSPAGDISPCPSTPTENVNPRHSSRDMDSTMPWKLVPISGLNLSEKQFLYLTSTSSYVDDPRVLHRRRRRSSSYSPHQGYKKGRSRTSRHERRHSRDQTSTPAKKETYFLPSKHCYDGVIENTVLEVYNTFSEKLYEVLKQKEVTNLGKTSTIPLLSSEERVVRLSDWLYTQASDLSVQEYVDELHEKLSGVVDSCINRCTADRPISDTLSEVKEQAASLLPKQEETTKSVPSLAEIEIPQEQGNFHSTDVNPKDEREQEPSRLIDYEPVSLNPANKEGTLPVLSQDLLETTDKTTFSLTDNLTASHSKLNDLINQMNPEVFNNLVKIFTHVNKNIVKFYIHTEEENATCKEIKEYLLRLGNEECDPEKFLVSKTVLTKLLIIIQNEDIAHFIHKIPALVALKRLPCVSFAGVDTLDDLKNHTYNELFVSGGFVVSDETVLNPESITADALKKFLMFLEEIDSPEGKWQWKIHCKFQKKLKELGRLNSNALSILTLLNTYQKKHLVEILAYHNCDSQTRQAPELDCLIRLQVQNIQQRHVVFITEKSASLFPDYSENGIIVTRMDDLMEHFTSLVGYHSSSTEENCLSQLATQESQTAPGENDVKDEDDMSIDSEDDIPQIEVCADSVKCEPHKEESTKEPDLDKPQTECPSNPTQNRTPILDSNDLQPVTPVTPAGSGENSMSTGNELCNNLQDYHSTETGMSHQFSQFNVLTHQTFLGAMHPVLASQVQQGENYFMGSYNQAVPPDTSQSSEWDQKWNLQ